MFQSFCAYESFSVREIFKGEPCYYPYNSTIILVSGSGGNYLKRQISHIHPEKNIFFESKGDLNSKQAVDLIAANIQSYRQKYGNILLILWTAICDLTSNVGQILMDMAENY